MRLVPGVCASIVCLMCAQVVLGACKIVQVAELSVGHARNRPLVDGRIDGHDVKILIDTGSSFSFVFQDAAARLGLPLQAVSALRVYGVGGEAKVNATLVRQLQFGSFIAKDLRLIVVGSRHANRPQGPALVLGEDFLSNFTTEFDLAHGSILLLRPEGCQFDQLPYWAKAYSLAELEPIDTDDPKIQTMVLLNGKPVTALLDTGAQTSAISSVAVRRIGLPAQQPGDAPTTSMIGIAGKPVQAASRQFDSFTIGDETIRNVRLRVADLFGRDTATETGSHIPKPIDTMPDMILGSDFFRSHRLVVLAKERKLLFTYNGGPIFQVVEPDVTAEEGQDPDNWPGGQEPSASPR
jgi:predicted aspartyl protease